MRESDELSYYCCSDDENYFDNDIDADSFEMNDCVNFGSHSYIGNMELADRAIREYRRSPEESFLRSIAPVPSPTFQSLPAHPSRMMASNQSGTNPTIFNSQGFRPTTAPNTNPPNRTHPPVTNSASLVVWTEQDIENLARLLKSPKSTFVTRLLGRTLIGLVNPDLKMIMQYMRTTRGILHASLSSLRKQEMIDFINRHTVETHPSYEAIIMKYQNLHPAPTLSSNHRQPLRSSMSYQTHGAIAQIIETPPTYSASTSITQYPTKTDSPTLVSVPSEEEISEIKRIASGCSLLTMKYLGFHRLKAPTQNGYCHFEIPIQATPEMKGMLQSLQSRWRIVVYLLNVHSAHHHFMVQPQFLKSFATITLNGTRLNLSATNTTGPLKTYLDITNEVRTLVASGSPIVLKYTVQSIYLGNAVVMVACQMEMTSELAIADLYISTLRRRNIFIAEEASPTELFAAQQRFFEHVDALADSDKNMILSRGDQDVEVGDQMVSLRCPLTLRRLRHAAKGEKCAHVQCFDIEILLQLYAKVDKWKCPLCSNAITREAIIMDAFTMKLLRDFPGAVSVVLHPNGTITAELEDVDVESADGKHSLDQDKPRSDAGKASEEDDDDDESNGIIHHRPSKRARVVLDLDEYNDEERQFSMSNEVLDDTGRLTIYID